MKNKLNKIKNVLTLLKDNESGERLYHLSRLWLYLEILGTAIPLGTALIFGLMVGYHVLWCKIFYAPYIN